MGIIWSAHLSMLFGELPFAGRPAAAAAAGFRAVETWWPEEEDEAVDAWVEEIRRAGLEVACLNSYCGVVAAGERGFLNLPDRLERTIGEFERAVALAARVGAGRINVLAGRAVAGTPLASQLDTVAGTLTELAAIATAAGVRIVVEPINELDIPGYLVPTAAAAVALIERVDSPSTRLLYDAYHAARGGADPVAEVRTLVDVIEHVQYADCPGRGAPGTGRVDLWRFVESLEAAGYDGALGLEFDPSGPTEEALAFLGTART